MAFSQDQVLCASRAWLDAVRRDWVRRRPNDLCWIPAWENLTPADRITVMTTIRAALVASEPASVQRALDRGNGND
jgi:hypothetical protein